VLIGRADVEDVVQPLGTTTLDLLPAGQIPPNPSELLGSPAMTGLLHRLTTSYDMVLLDSPPLLPVTDAAVLSKLAGGALVVVGGDRIHRAQLQETLGSLQTAGAHVLGIVLNKIDRREAGTYSYYGSGYAPTDADQSKAEGDQPQAATPDNGQPIADHQSKATTRARRASDSDETVEMELKLRPERLPAPTL
jgi:polysaccharide biosynthesis transport protein